MKSDDEIAQKKRAMESSGKIAQKKGRYAPKLNPHE